MTEPTPAGEGVDGWRDALARLQALLELSDEDRATALAALPPVLRGRVERLLRAHARPSPLDRAPPLVDGALAVPAADAPAQEDTAGRRLGRWLLLEPLGQGGMSVVWRARSVAPPLGQRAALKRLAAASAGPDARRRFAREIDILVRLQHPGIAAILDAGHDDHGMPWFAMALVDGEPIDDWCSRTGAGMRARVGLLSQAARAVAHAHRYLVVHRDIKPGNVMVDAAGRVVLVDFGISRLIEEGADGDNTGVYAFTPRFAAPEQRSGGSLGTATDLWGLGALGHHLLLGRAPALEPDAAGVAPPPSLPRDLAAILARCLRRDPAHRYTSADALADDLDAWADGRPVQARDGGRLYRFGRFVRRRPGIVALSFALVASLTLGLVAARHQASRAEAEAVRARAAQQSAEEALTRATSLRGYLVEVFRGSNPNDGPQASAADLLARGEALAGEREASGDPLLAADLRLVLGRARLLRGEYDPAVRLFREGLAVLEAEPGAAPVTRAELYWGLGEEARARGRHADAGEAYAQALAAAQEAAAPPDVVAGFELDLLVALSAGGGREQPLERMEAWLQAVEAWPEPDDALVLRALNLKSTMLALAGTPDAGPLQERRLALAERVYADQPGWLAFAHADAVPSFRRWRAWDRAEASARRALAIIDAQYPGPHVMAAIATCNAAGLAIDRGRPTEAMALLDRTLAIDAALGRRHVHALSCLLHRAEARRELGDDEGALEELRRAEAMLDALALTDDTPWRRQLCQQRVRTSLAAGRDAEAWEMLERCPGEPNVWLLAERALERGDTAAAAAALDGVGAWTRPPPRDAPAGLREWLLVAGLAQARGDADAGARRAALREAVAVIPRPWEGADAVAACLEDPAAPAWRCLPRG